jgi:glycosyltransferase involved in cell wall biosynthesis
MSIRLSVLVPVFNEEDWIAATIERMLSAPLGPGVDLEIIVVDDGSTDGTREMLELVEPRCGGRLKLVPHDRNRGKGAAIRTAIAHATGEFAVIQDADLEYNPQDLPRLLRPLFEGHADAVFGSRFMAAGERRVLYFWHALANRFLTTACNMVADLNLTDMETGYKAFRVSLVQSIPLRSDRFGIEPELTIKLAQRGVAIYEVPISYRGRTYDEGKKIGLKDAIQAMFLIAYYGLRRDIYLDKGARILDALSETRRFNRWMADTIRGYVGKHVIEIGAGIGNMSQHLASRRKSYTASDYDLEHVARLRARFQGRPNVSLRLCDLTASADFEAVREQADTVICLNVLEHIEDDAAGLRNIASALLPGGRAIVLVPQDQAIYGTLDRVLGHYRRYSEAELRKRMEEAGFDVERVLHFNRVTRPGWYWNGRILKRQHFSRFQLRVFDWMVWLWRRIDRFLPWPSVSIIGIGRKRAATPAPQG